MSSKPKRSSKKDDPISSTDPSLQAVRNALDEMSKQVQGNPSAAQLLVLMSQLDLVKLALYNVYTLYVGRG